MRGYVVVFEGDDESGYSAYSPDLPGVIAAGDSRQETEALMIEAAELPVDLGQLREGGVAEQAGQPPGMHENRALPGPDAPVGDAGDQPGQGARGVGGVEEDALGAGGQPHRRGGTRGQRGVTSAHLIPVDLQPGSWHMPAGHSVE